MKEHSALDPVQHDADVLQLTITLSHPDILIPDFRTHTLLPSPKGVEGPIHALLLQRRELGNTEELVSTFANHKKANEQTKPRETEERQEEFEHKTYQSWLA